MKERPYTMPVPTCQPLLLPGLTAISLSRKPELMIGRLDYDQRWEATVDRSSIELARRARMTVGVGS